MARYRKRIMQYELDSRDPAITLDRISTDKGRIWAITQGNNICLNKDGNWEYQPMPSNRSEAFLNRCRFGTEKQALRAYQKHILKHNKSSIIEIRSKR